MCQKETMMRMCQNETIMRSVSEGDNDENVSE